MAAIGVTVCLLMVAMVMKTLYLQVDNPGMDLTELAKSDTIGTLNV